MVPAAVVEVCEDGRASMDFMEPHPLVQVVARSREAPPPRAS